MRRLTFLLSVVLLLAYPQKSWALQEEPEPARPEHFPDPSERDPATGLTPRQAKEKAKEDAKAAQDAEDKKEADKQGIPLQTYQLEKELRQFDALNKQMMIRDLWNRAEKISGDSGDGGALTLVWSVDEQKRYSVHIRRGSSMDTKTVNWMVAADRAQLNQLVATAGVTMLAGDFPESPGWHRWLSTSCKLCVLPSRRSANRDIPEKAFAALLGREVRSNQNLRVYNALPSETGADGVSERTRMRIEGSEQDWAAVNDRIRDALSIAHHLPNSTIWQTAEKDRLLEELREGESNVVLIFAHSDGSKIYMPGKSGSSISTEELRAVRHWKAPNRVVILVACEAGAVNQGTQSIAEALLESDLATTVFAYPGLISASYVPEMLARLSAGTSSLRDALPGLYQIVSLRGAHNELCPSLRLRSGIQFQQFYGATARRRYIRRPTDIPWREKCWAIVSVGFV